MKLTRILGAAALSAVLSTAAFASGMFSNLPVVGSVAYCVLFAGDGTTCSGFEPAGPTIVTGNERIPADTVLPNGQAPQSVRVPLPAIGAGPYQYATPLTGTTIAVNAVSRRLMLNPAGTIAALTVTLPAASALIDNQSWGLCSTQIVTALTLTAGSGTTVSNTVTALAVPPGTGAGTCYEWTYNQPQTTWFRTQ